MNSPFKSGVSVTYENTYFLQDEEGQALKEEDFALFQKQFRASTKDRRQILLCLVYYDGDCFSGDTGSCRERAGGESSRDSHRASVNRKCAGGSPFHQPQHLWHEFLPDRSQPGARTENPCRSLGRKRNLALQ